MFTIDFSKYLYYNALYVVMFITNEGEKSLMFCSYCGNKIADDSIFCSHCGQKQHVAADEETQDNSSDIAEASSLELPDIPEDISTECSADEPVSEQGEQDQWYVEPIQVSDDKISCPMCNHIQLASRKRCCKCGTYFDKALEEKLKNRIILPEQKQPNTNKEKRPVFCCPSCGHKDLQVINETSSQTSGGGYSAGKGCLGYLLLGPLGLLCGSCGQSQTTTTTHHTYWACPRCGKKFEHPDELRNKINSLESPIFATMSAIGGVIALILFLIFEKMDIGLALFIGLFTLGFFALIGFGVQKTFETKSQKLENELRELETNMQKFSNE